MNESPVANILILAANEETARRWAEILRNRHARVSTRAADVAAELAQAQLDLIVTDADPSRQLPAGPSNPSPAEDALADPPGVIVVGGQGPADICLPADATPRELQLACRLMAEIVRLRRALRARTEIQHRLAHEALTDPLTGLPNRRAWDQTLPKWLTMLANSRSPFCLAILDLDHFKQVNDARGHSMGDDVLRAAGRVLTGSLRQDDFVARLGGDEFGLLLAVRDEATAAAVVDRVRRGLPAILRQADLPAVTASAGFCLAACAPAPLPCPDTLLASADEALRMAKSAGRDRTVGCGH